MATSQNARANGVRIDRVSRIDLRRDAPPPARTVAANLTARLLRRLADAIEPLPAALIASGLLEEEADDFVAAFAGLEERRRLCDSGWAALLVTERGGGGASRG
jgi:ribosomal protein L11 methylase PrmA